MVVDARGPKGIFKGLAAIHVCLQGLFVASIPKPRRAVASPEGPFTLNPQSLLISEHSFHMNQLPFASFGIEKSMLRAYSRNDACFPRMANMSSNRQIIFDLFLRDHDNPSEGYTVNRYRLDLHVLVSRTGYHPDTVDCSLSIEETFTVKNTYSGSWRTFYRPSEHEEMVLSTRTTLSIVLAYSKWKENSWDGTTGV